MNRFLATAVILLAALVAVPVSADQRKGNDDGNNGRDNSDRPRVENKSSLTDSVRRVERQTGGQVLSAEPVQRDGRQVNRVKVLTNDGRVRVMQVDAQQDRKKIDPPAPRSRNNTDKGGGDPDQF
jgi:uncharacterized membrane protein YkoI